MIWYGIISTTSIGVGVVTSSQLQSSEFLWIQNLIDTAKWS